MSRDDRAAARERERIEMHRRWREEQARRPPPFDPRCHCGAPGKFAVSTWWKHVFLCADHLGEAENFYR